MMAHSTPVDADDFLGSIPERRINDEFAPRTTSVKVYILEEDHFPDAHSLLGVFATWELACTDQPGEWGSPNDGPIWWSGDFSITEAEVEVAVVET